MNPGNRHDVWGDSTAAYLLGALPDDERPGFEAHLAGCPSCREEVDRLRVAADALPASPVQLAPPPELKGRIMAIVDAEAELLRAAGSGADRAAAPPAPAAGAARRRWLRWLSLRPALALAGAAAALVVAVVVAGGSDTRTVVPQVTVANASAKLIVREDDHSTLETKGLPRAGPGRVYQVWLKPKGQDPKPTDALFSVRTDGSASVDVPGSLKGIEAVMVTSEPDGGSKVPTRKPVIVATLS